MLIKIVFTVLVGVSFLSLGMKPAHSRKTFSLTENLFLAIEKNDIHAVKKMLKKVADINIKNHNNINGLSCAVGCGHKHIIELLLSKGADPNITYNIPPEAERKGVECVTNLMTAVKNGNKEVAEMLIKAGADVNAQDSDGSTALTYAVFKGDRELVRLILDKGASLHLTYRRGVSILMATLISGDKEIAEMLIDAGADINAQDLTGATTLHRAVTELQEGIVKVLLDKGANPDCLCKDIVLVQGKCFISPLVAAVTKGNKKIIELLLDARASLEVPVECAAQFCKGVIELFKKEALPGQLVNEIIKQKYSGIISALVKVGFKGNVRGEYGSTPLMIASFHSDIEMVKMLIDAGADVNAQDDNSETALSNASYKGHTDIVRLLLIAGGVADSKAFLYAAQRGKVEVMHILIDAKVEDTYGYCKLSYPQAFNHRQCHFCKKNEEAPSGRYKILKLCGGCKVIRYCSEQCQLSDWDSHKTFCFSKCRLDKKLQFDQCRTTLC